MSKRVRLSKVEGDQEDFADLIGQKGVLETGSHSFFLPEKGDRLSFMWKRMKTEGMTIVIETELDNTFTFTVLPTFSIVKKDNPEEWLIFQPGGRLDHWGSIMERVEFHTKQDAITRRRNENAESFADVVEITSDTDLKQYNTVA